MKILSLKNKWIAPLAVVFAIATGTAHAIVIPGWERPVLSGRLVGMDVETHEKRVKEIELTVHKTDGSRQFTSLSLKVGNVRRAFRVVEVLAVPSSKCPLVRAVGGRAKMDIKFSCNTTDSEAGTLVQAKLQVEALTPSGEVAKKNLYFQGRLTPVYTPASMGEAGNKSMEIGQWVTQTSCQVSAPSVSGPGDKSERFITFFSLARNYATGKVKAEFSVGRRDMALNGMALPIVGEIPLVQIESERAESIPTTLLAGSGIHMEIQELRGTGTVGLAELVLPAYGINRDVKLKCKYLPDYRM